MPLAADRCRKCRSPLVGSPDSHRGLCYIHRNIPTETTKQATPRPLIDNPTPAQLALAERFPGEVRAVLTHLDWRDGSRVLASRAVEIARRASAGRTGELNKILRGLGHRGNNPAVDIVKHEIRRVSRSLPSSQTFSGGLPGQGSG